MKEDNKKDWKKVIEASELEDNVNAASTDEIIPLDEDEDEDEVVSLEHPSYRLLEEKLTETEQLAFDNKERAARALAELENVRRRTDRDIANAHRYGQDKLILSLLPVIDSLEQAIQLTDKQAEGPMVEGLELTLKLFLDALAKFDVQQLNPEGVTFDPQEHEAMSILDVPNAVPNSIVTVFQKGYKLAERVIRPARVIVAKNKE